MISCSSLRSSGSAIERYDRLRALRFAGSVARVLVELPIGLFQSRTARGHPGERDRVLGQESHGSFGLLNSRAGSPFWPLRASGGLGEVAAMKSEREVVRHPGTSDLAEGGGVQSEQERGAGGAVEHD